MNRLAASISFAGVLEGEMIIAPPAARSSLVGVALWGHPRFRARVTEFVW